MAGVCEWVADSVARCPPGRLPAVGALPWTQRNWYDRNMISRPAATGQSVISLGFYVRVGSNCRNRSRPGAAGLGVMDLLETVDTWHASTPVLCNITNGTLVGMDEHTPDLRAACNCRSRSGTWPGDAIISESRLGWGWPTIQVPAQAIDCPRLRLTCVRRHHHY